MIFLSIRSGFYSTQGLPELRNRLDNVDQFNSRPQNDAACHQDRIHRQSQVVPDHVFGLEDDHDVVLTT